jgi:DNA-binding transcriptional LysR family regulator
VRIEQLEYAAAVARFGSFRRAAEELHISQPALSETVRKLEAELGVDILDRQRTGAIISDEGRELLPHLLDVIEAAKRLRYAADEQHKSSRMVRLGTVSAATSPLLTATIRAFRETHPATQVEVVLVQQQRLHRLLLEGGLDLGLVNYLDGDEVTPELHTVELLRGYPVVCIHSDSPLAARSTVSPAQLVTEPLIVMRSGYAMHRYLLRLLGGGEPAFSYSADGAEMGKLMVAAGLGATVLPSYSVIGDPLEERGAIIYRKIQDDVTNVRLVLQRRRSGSPTLATRDLHTLFVDEAVAYAATAAEALPGRSTKGTPKRVGAKRAPGAERTPRVRAKRAPGAAATPV